MSDVINLKQDKEQDNEEKPVQQSVESEQELVPAEPHVIEPQLATYKTETIYHEWEALEYEFHPKDKKWYTYVALFTSGTVILAIIFNAGLSALIFGLIGAIIILVGGKEPQNMVFSIDPMGVAVGEKFHSYDQLDSFWIHYTPEVQEISLKSKKMFSVYIKLPLGNQDPVMIRTLLADYLKEERQEEEISDLITRRLRF